MLTTKIHKVNVSELKSLISKRPRIPDGKSGKVSIDHKTIKPRTKINAVSMRNAIFMKESMFSIKFSYPFKIRSLHSTDHGKWMTDNPCEIWQMREPLEQAYGRVLVGGLGLGVVSHLMSLQDDVDFVITVEIDKDIIKLVKPHIDPDYIINKDLFDYIDKIPPDAFNFAFFDIWQGTGETTWCEQVVPLHRLCRNKIKTVYCWCEEEMLGQCMLNMPQVADMDSKCLGYHTHNKVFREAVVKKKLRPKKARITNETDHNDRLNIMQENQGDRKLMGFLNHFLHEVGTDRWEKNFGDLWDSISNEKEERWKSVK